MNVITVSISTHNQEDVSLSILSVKHGTISVIVSHASLAMS